MDAVFTERQVARMVQKAFRNGWEMSRAWPNHDPIGVLPKISADEVTLVGKISTTDFTIELSE